MAELAVWILDIRAGVLTQGDDGRMSFAYSPAYCSDPNASPLSRLLPLGEQAFPTKTTRAYFAGVLPEEGVRIRIAELLGLSADNDFALLERIGGECAGAVSLQAMDWHPADFDRPSLRKLDDVTLLHLMRELPARPLMADEKGVRLSLAGAQDKLPVVVHDRSIHLALSETPSTHILKPEAQRFPGLAANETFCMRLARAVGLRVADIEFGSVENQNYVLVKRFDRTVDESRNAQRLHQEDFCQALGFPPERKYQAEHGPTVKDCIELIWDWSTFPALDLRDFVQLLVFNVLIGNADAHGKNFSFLYTGSERRISPAYDLVSTLAWPELTTSAAMKIGGCSSINAFGEGDWKKLADQAQLSWVQVQEWLIQVATEVIDGAAVVASELAEIDPVRTREFANVVEQRASKLLSQFG